MSESHPGNPSENVVNASRATTWLVVSAALLAALFKIYCAWTTFGTTDVYLLYIYAKSIIDHGLEATYRSTTLFNHTPLTASYITTACAISEAWKIPFPFLIKLPCIIADFLVVLVLLAARKDGIPNAGWLAFFALSPVSFMVTGYHGNVDPVLVLFLVLAAWMCMKDHHLPCGLFLGLACNIKIVAILLAPVFFFYWVHRGKGLRFTAVTIAVCLAGWSLPLIQYPGVFIKNVFGYSSYWGVWGVTYWLRATHAAVFQPVTWSDMTPAEHTTIAILKGLIVSGILVLAWKRRTARGQGIFATIACAWAIFFMFSPGVGVQYMVWPAPFILLAAPWWYAAFVLAASAYLFVFYNVISHGMPWHHGISTNQLVPLWVSWTNPPWIVFIGGLVWLLWKWIKKPADETVKTVSTPI